MKKILLFTTFFILFSTLATLPSDRDDNCFTIIAGKNTTVNGAVMIAHNEDDRGENYFVNMHKLSHKNYQEPEIYKFKNGGSYQISSRLANLWIEIRGTEFGDSYINEKGVVIVSNACKSRENKGELTSGGIGPLLRRIVAEKAKSAKEAVTLAGQLIEKYGYYSSGRSYAIADKTEGWFLQVVKGKHWVARRVPDDSVSVIPNYYTIEEVDLNDTKNFLGSKDIISYARERGWYDPKRDGKFNFRKVYSDKENLNAEYNRLRHWRAVSLLTKSEVSPKDDLPFAFRPAKSVKIVKLFEILRDHYEGTEYDLSNRYRNGSPNSTGKRTICTDSTQYSLVGNLRNKLPNEIAPQIWISFRRPDSNSYSPWYPSINSTPYGYTRGDSEKAIDLHLNNDKSFYKFDKIYPYWNYVKLSNKVDKNYRMNIKKVKKIWRNFEDFLFHDIKKQEKEFLYIYKKNRILALNIISNYVKKMEYRRWLKTIDILNSLR